VPTARARAAELRQDIAAARNRWLHRLVGTELAVLAERGGTGHSAEFAPVRLPAGTPAGTLVTVTPQHVVEGMLE
jgi:threonylcarbamoyladenosine tRNA methylthiotransferase MtaB